MRFRAVLISAFSLICATGVLAAPALAHAQQEGGGNTQDDAKKRRLDREMQTQALPLPPVKADDVCPFVKVLYDAARTIDFKDNKQASGSVAWSGEIQGLLADCSYKGTDPIKVQTNLTFLFGRGPQAQTQARTFTYWIAVTDRDRAVLEKEYFSVDVNFPPNSDRVIVVEQINEIRIPRAGANVSGANFEILVGFDVTPEMAEFNRQGARFRINASGGDAGSAATAGARTSR